MTEVEGFAHFLTDISCAVHYATRGDSLESQTDTDPATVKHPGCQER